MPLTRTPHTYQPPHRPVPTVRLTTHPCGCILAADPLYLVWYLRYVGVPLMTVRCDQHTPKEPHVLAQPEHPAITPSPE
jgi:hypothetical protein